MNPSAAENRELRLTINGRAWQSSVPVRKTLLDFLREDAGLTGTHAGCEHGVCGCCSVLLDGEAVRSCLLFAVQLEGCHLTTVEGLAPEGHLHPLQRAFAEHHALQCGYCTPGMLITACDLLEHNPSPTEPEIREAIAGNLCRCTGYVQIVEAIAATARDLAVQHSTI
jgi:aerobic-type carbon monoxide dehydrogenase small subunit (CoxS/CutS family)